MASPKIYKCPLCEFKGYTKQIVEHIVENKKNEYQDFKNKIINEYVELKMSPDMIGKQYFLSMGLISYLLEYQNVKMRNHQEAVVNAVSQNRQNINTYGIGGFRKDLNKYFKSCQEANFARILQYEKITYQTEIAYNLYFEENNKKRLICTYFLDFLTSDSQGFEIKSYIQNGKFPNKEKILLFKKQYPNIKLKVLFCSSQEWKEIKNKYERLIPLWETTERNIRTHPEFFGIN